jgi:hypothetical protein
VSERNPELPSGGMIPATVLMLNEVMARDDAHGAVMLPGGHIGLVWGDDIVLRIERPTFFTPAEAKRTLWVIGRKQRYETATQATLDKAGISEGADPKQQSPHTAEAATAEADGIAVIEAIMPDGYTPVKLEAPLQPIPEADPSFFDAVKALAPSVRSIELDDLPDLPASLRDVTGGVHPPENRPKKPIIVQGGDY